MKKIVLMAISIVTAAAADEGVEIVDPSAFSPGTDISNSFDGVVLSTAVGSMEIVDTTVTIPLTLTSDLTTEVFTTGTAFSHLSGDIWSAGQCCAGDQVLRADFSERVLSVAVLFLPTDTDTGVLQIYDRRDRLLGEKIFRSSEPFTLSLESPQIAYALATFGDTGRIGSLTFERRRPH